MKNKKAILLGAVVLGVLMCTSLVSAYGAYYGSYGYTNYGYGGGYKYQPARIGGWFGQSMDYVYTPLRANYIQQPCLSARPSTYYVSSCGSYGTWGYRSGYGGYSGYGGNSYNRYPSYNYGYGGTL
jgi:hypothetical protein